MSSNITYSALAKAVSHINNPNFPTGTLLEEVPCCVGRSYAGYKRGGVIEGAEKLRRESMAGAFWLFGIPAFNRLGNLFSEKVLKIPTEVDFSNAKHGRDALKDTAEFLTMGIKNADDIPDKFKDFDCSEIIKKYGDTFKGADVENLAKKMKSSKMVSSLVALALNCVVMGVALPKFNQYLTKKKLQKIKAQDIVSFKAPSMDEFKTSVQEKNKNNDVSFSGVQNILPWVVYNVNNNNTFRLISTDIPMITGRVATSRNKYEGLENLLIDGGSIYFYNFCAKNVQDGLRKASKIPSIDPKIAEFIANKDLKDVFSKLNDKSTLQDLFDADVIKEVYKEGTHGKFGKINRFVKRTDLEDIDKQVVKFLSYIQESAKKSGKELFVGDKINEDVLKSALKKVNVSNAKYLTCGILASILGLSVIVPKVTFWVTKKITGKNEFTGIADYSDNQSNKS